MRIRFWLIASAVLLPLRLPAQIAPAVPIKRVVLYKNGVGYFEHLGSVRGNQPVTISFTSGQLNDVLKSLTVLDLNGGRIKGVEYGSAAPADRQLNDLRLPLNEKTTLTEFLGGLRGAKLEVKSGTTVLTGRLLSVERKTRIAGGTTLEVDYLSLMTDSGELKTTELSPSFSVKMLEKGLPDKVDRYLDLVSAGRQPDVRQMVISTEGTGDRSVFVSYISETPVWKSTYRIVLGSKAGQKPLLQGWAIVDNTVGQNWENVQLSLVAGAPQSFVQNLSQPYYSRRPVVALPQSVNRSPQTFEATLMTGGARLTGRITDPAGGDVRSATVKAFDSSGTLVAETTASATGVYEFQALPDGPIRLEIVSPGFQRAVINGVVVSPGSSAQRDVRLQMGSVSQSVEVTAAVPMIQTDSAMTSTRGGFAKKAPPPPMPTGRTFDAAAAPYDASGLSDARGRVQSSANAQELGDLFEYKLKELITIQENQSALVPIVQADIVADKVSIWNEQSGFPRPQRALWLTNSSGLTLDGGSFSVLEAETFAGEGIFESIRPNEKRLVSYATDLALNASSRSGSEKQRISRVLVKDGVLTHRSEVRENKTYTFRNEDTSSRAVIVEHPVRQGYELRSEVKPIESTAGWMRFRVQVEPKQTAALVVEESRPVATTYELTDLTSDAVVLFVNQKSIDKTIEAALRQILTQKAAVGALLAQKNARESETSKIFEDQERLRSNMEALKTSTEERALLRRYTQQMSDQETRLETLRKEIKELNTQGDKAQAELDRMIEGLSFDLVL